jgi:predicted adenine nucleotide alpha hydrolase (AANH) superfamily ATPase
MKDKKLKLLLSACCGPCSTVALERLLPDYNITILFYGSNLDSPDEYSRRLSALQTVNARLNGDKPMILIDYDRGGFMNEVAELLNEKEGGRRCEKCFALRLNATAQTAKLRGFDLFATTLTTSPRKNAEIINKIGEQAADEYKIKYLPTDFKQNGGFTRSAQLSKELGIYRQKYCGCNL